MGNEKNRIVLKLAFNGGRYHGWQIQNNAETIQGVLTEALCSLYSQKITLTGCSRTDAGVHANVYYCHFDVANNIPVEKIPYALNGMLPGDIAVSGAMLADEDFNSRYGAVLKEYKYYLWDGGHRNPVYHDMCYHSIYRLDARKMDEAARFYCGEHDFSSFMAQGSEVKSTTRNVFYAGVGRENGFTVFTVAANGFLYNMARIMAGTLLYVSNGKINLNDITEIIESHDRERAGPTLPPQGLFLNKVFYDTLKL